MTRHAPGIDFGTTNSAVAWWDGRAVRLARHAPGGAAWFRSVMHFVGPSDVVAGPAALARYLAGDAEGRLIQSLKSHLSSELSGTTVFGRRYALEDLAAVLVRALRVSAEAGGVDLGPRAVVGRPVRFVGAEGPADEARALGRLRAAFANAGFDDVTFVYEPVGAAWHYEAGLDHDELVMIGDFGGGTSDFCLLRVGPGARKARAGRDDGGIVATAGVGLAGDALDAEIVSRVVAPALGQGTVYRSYLDGKALPVPPWVYDKLRRWHHLSFLKAPETLRFLREVRVQSEAPERIAALLHVIEDDLGYHLARAVESTKVALSAEAEAGCTFVDDPVSIEARVTRAEFEAWTAPTRSRIAACVDAVLSRARVSEGEVDRVFLTGGSSLVPSVRALFDARFGPERVRVGDALTSVVQGLARVAVEVYG